MGWQEGGNFKRFYNLLENFTTGKVNPQKKKSCSWCRRTLSHRLLEVLQEEVLLNITLLLYFSPLHLLLVSFRRQNIRQQTMSPIQYYDFYVVSAYVNP